MNNTFQPTGNNDITIEQFFDFVKKSDTEKLDDVATYSRSTLYYMKKFKKYGHRKFFFSLNWACAFNGANWFAYRGMFWIFYILILPITLFVLAEIFKNTSSAYLLIMIAYEISACILYPVSPLLVSIILFMIQLFAGNMIYFHHVRKSIKRLSIYRGVSIFSVYIVWVISICFGITQLVQYKRAELLEQVTENALTALPQALPAQ